MNNLTLIICLLVLSGCGSAQQVRESKGGSDYQVEFVNMNKDKYNEFESDPFSMGNQSMSDEKSVEITMGDNEEGFVIAQSGRASLSDKQILIIGRYQVYVRRGSQYATWRQFPQSIYFEMIVRPGKIEVTPDYSMSISDSIETHQSYSERPADKIIGADFKKNVFPDVSRFIDKPGNYKIRARYFNHESNWLEITVAP